MVRKIKTIFLLFFIIYNINLFASAGDWTVKLSLLKKVWYPGEPIYVAITKENNTREGLMEALKGKYYLDDKPCNLIHVIACRGEDLGASGTPKLEPPGTIYNYIQNINNNCPGLGIGDHKHYPLGKHKYCYKSEDYENCAEFELAEPKRPIDRAAYYDLLEQQYDIDILHGRSRSITEKYPTSIYAAWEYYNNMWTPRKAISEGSSDIQKSVDRAIRISKGEDIILRYFPFLDPNYSPDDICSKGHMHFYNHKNAANFYKQKARIILTYHPDFIFADQVRLGLAIAEIALGNEAEGIKQIQDLIQNKQKEAIQQNKEISFEGKWAEEFLKKWFQQKL